MQAPCKCYERAFSSCQLVCRNSDININLCCISCICIIKQCNRQLNRGIADKTVFRDLQDLVIKGIIKPEGKKKGRYYKLIK